jgi:hypothetical protein
MFGYFTAIIRRWHDQERFSTIIVMLVGLLVFAVKFYFDLQIIAKYLQGISSQVIWIALWNCTKYLVVQKVYWCAVPLIVLSTYWATWVVDAINFVSHTIQKVRALFDTRQAMTPSKVNTQSLRANVTPSSAMPSTPQDAAPKPVPPIVTTSKVMPTVVTPLPAQMTIDLISDIPTIYHASTIAAHTFNTIWQPLSKEPRSQVREKHVLPPNPESVEILYQPREYYVIAANYPFDHQGLETRTLKLGGASYSCITLTDPKDKGVLEWLHQNQISFIGGQSRAVYDGSTLTLPFFGRYVPRTLYLRPHLVKPYLTQSELERLLVERIRINDKKLNYYTLVVDGYDNL